MPAVLLVLPWWDVVTVTLPVVLVTAVVVLRIPPPRLGLPPVDRWLWVRYRWAVIHDHGSRCVAVSAEVVIHRTTRGVVIVVAAAAIAVTGAGVAWVGERLGCFEVVARTIGAHLSESNAEMGTTYIEGSSEGPTGQLCRSRNRQKGEQDSHEKKSPERYSKLHVGHLLTAR
jgi:hypothetical protein